MAIMRGRAHAQHICWWSVFPRGQLSARHYRPGYPVFDIVCGPCIKCRPTNSTAVTSLDPGDWLHSHSPTVGGGGFLSQLD